MKSLTSINLEKTFFFHTSDECLSSLCHCFAMLALFGSSAMEEGGKGVECLQRDV